MICENCETEYAIKYGSGRFCSKQCACAFSTKAKRKEINKAVSNKLINRVLSDDHCENIKAAWVDRKKRPRGPNKSLTPNDLIFVENSSYTTALIKRRIIAYKLLDYKCEICDNPGTHNNKPLTLQLDHKNGKNRDHRLDNLRFLCPNCHTQTETYAGKKTKKK